MGFEFGWRLGPGRRIPKHEALPEYTDVIVQRHGPRSPSNLLAEHAPEHIRAMAQSIRDSLLRNFGEAHRVTHAMGSPSRPKESDSFDKARAMVTAATTASEIQGEGTPLQPSVETLMHYDHYKTPAAWVYDHVKVYNLALWGALAQKGHLSERTIVQGEDPGLTPDEVDILKKKFDSLPPDEQDLDSYVAQEATLDLISSIDTPVARQFKLENAGGFAQAVIERRFDLLRGDPDVGKRGKESTALLKGSDVLTQVMGTHGGVMEYLITHALVFERPDGTRVTGSGDLAAIGGAFDTSEAYTLRIPRDPSALIPVVFHGGKNTTRPEGVYYLDPARVQELAAQYRDLRGHFDRLDALKKAGDKAGFDAYRLEHKVYYQWDKDEKVLDTGLAE